MTTPRSKIDAPTGVLGLPPHADYQWFTWFREWFDPMVLAGHRPIAGTR